MIISTAVLLSVSYRGFQKLKQKAADRLCKPALVTTALNRLASQAAAARRLSAEVPFVAESQLRDDLLRHETDERRRQALWIHVRKIVERNANVRSTFRESEKGDLGRVWEWIGIVPLTSNEVDSGNETEYRSRPYRDIDLLSRAHLAPTQRSVEDTSYGARSTSRAVY